MRAPKTFVNLVLKPSFSQTRIIIRLGRAYTQSRELASRPIHHHRRGDRLAVGLWLWPHHTGCSNDVEGETTMQFTMTKSVHSCLYGIKAVTADILCTIACWSPCARCYNLWNHARKKHVSGITMKIYTRLTNSVVERGFRFADDKRDAIFKWRRFY